MISDEEVNKYSNFAKSLRSLNVIRNDTLELGMCNYIEMAPFDRSHPSSWFRMALSYIVFDIKRYVVENRDFYTPPHSTPRLGGPCRNIAITFGTEKTRIVSLPDSKKN